MNQTNQLQGESQHYNPSFKEKHLKKNNAEKDKGTRLCTWAQQIT